MASARSESHVMRTARTTSLLRLARNLARNRRGSAAVEFAMIAPVFFALLFAIIETAMVFFASQLLETATQDTARLIMTGQAQASSAPLTQAQFKTKLCLSLSALFDCDGGIYVDVQSYASFGAITMSDQIDASRNFNTTMQYKPGGAGDVVVVRVFYQWPLFVTGLGYNIANINGSKRLLVGTAVFRNEPFA
jgi:Flp pilus assembly protein TadG